MVSKNDLFLIGGGLLAFLLFKERVPEIKDFKPYTDFTRVQRIDIQEIQAAETAKQKLESVKQQLLGVKQQVLDFEQEQAKQKISFIEEEIEKAKVAGSEYQNILSRRISLSRTASDRLRQYGSAEAAYQSLAQGSPKQQLQAQGLKAILVRQQAREQLEPIENFIDKARAGIEEIKQKQAELRQIV